MAGSIESRSEREQVDGLLDRIESGIVAYEEWEIDVREFSSPSELQRSLREVLPHIPVPVIVVALDLPALRAASNAPMLFERHRGGRSRRGILEVDRRYFSGVPRSVDDLAEEWFVSSGDRARTFTLSLSIDGGRVRGFAADHCLSLDDVRDRQAEEERGDNEAGWFGIGFAGLPSLLASRPVDPDCRCIWITTDRTSRSRLGTPVTGTANWLVSVRTTPGGRSGSTTMCCSNSGNWTRLSSALRRR